MSRAAVVETPHEEERAEKLLSVVGERIREVRELPGELEVPVRPDSSDW